MHHLLVAGLAAENLNGAVGDHLVHVHVRLRAGAGLEHDEREVLHQLALRHLTRRLLDRRRALRLEAKLDVDRSARLLEGAESADEGLRHTETGLADVEVHQRSSGVKRVGGSR